MDSTVSRHEYWLMAVGLVVVNSLAHASGHATFQIMAIPFTLSLWLAVAAIRSRTIGRSGWLCLLTLIPVAGLPVVIWLGTTHDEPSVQHGKDLLVAVRDILLVSVLGSTLVLLVTLPVARSAGWW